MKNHKILGLVALVLSIVSLHAFADIRNAPFQPEVDVRFNAIEGTMSSSVSTLSAVSDYTTVGQKYARVMKVTYQPAVDGGSIAGHVLSVSVPANALITKGYAYMAGTLLPNAVDLVSIQCRTAGDLFTAVDLHGVPAGSSFALKPQIIGTTMLDATGTGCTPAVVVGAGTTLTGGKLDIYLEYVLHD